MEGTGSEAGQAPWQPCLPLPLVAHHDLDNTLNCSFLEPPSGLEQPSPSWSSRASFSSFDTTDEGPVYCVPHEGEHTLLKPHSRPGKRSSLKDLCAGGTGIMERDGVVMLLTGGWAHR